LNRVGTMNIRASIGSQNYTGMAPLLVSTLLSAALFFGSASAEGIAPCQVPKDVTSTSLESGTPAALVRALKERVGEIAAQGEKFDVTDVVVTGRSRRLIFVWHLRRRWVVAIERGGIAYSDPIVAYDLSPDGGTAALVQERIALPDTVCATASSLLDFEPRIR
jgi:hypothetical protein